MEDFYSGEIETLELESESLQALTIEDFDLGEFAGIGMIAGGSGLIVSLLVVEILSILRLR